MTWIAPGRRRIVGALAALVLVLSAIGVASPASATSGGGGSAGTQGICDPTWWVLTSIGLGNKESPLFYYAANSSIQFRVTNIYNYKRTYSNCSVRYTKGGTASKFRICSSASSCNNWQNVTRGCTVEPTKYKGYNYGRGLCNYWSA